MLSGGRALVEQFYGQFSSGDLDEAVELFEPDVVTVEPFLGRAENRDAWRAYGEAFRRACPDARLVLRSAVEEDDRVAVEGTFVGTFTGTLDGPTGPVPPTGRAFNVEFADFFQIRRPGGGPPHLLRPGRLPWPTGTDAAHRSTLDIAPLPAPGGN
jgi:ketosteroid isomerase-like protein